LQAKSIKENDDYLVLRGGNIQNGKIITDTKDVVYVDSSLVKEVQEIKKGDVVIVGSTGSKRLIGKAGIAKKNYKEISFGAFLMLIRPSGLINKSLFDYYFISDNYRNVIRKLAGGVNINNIRREYITNLKFPLPPLAEQQRIVAKLDELFGHLDTLKTRLNSIPQILKNFRQAVLNQAVTGKLTEEWREGKDLGEWENVILKDITIKIGSGSTPRGGSESYKNEGTPLVRSMNIRFNGIKLKGLAFIDEKQAERLKNVTIQENDILLNITGASIGRVCLAEKSIVGGRVNQHVTIIRLNEDNYSEYINMYLASSLIQNYIFIENYGVTRQALTKTQTQNLKINLPPKKEQTEIVRSVKALFAKADAIETAYQNLKQQIDALPQAILAKAFKGELVAQLPTDGDAKDLLKEIVALRALLEKEKKSEKKKKVNA
jgi:type I restriction enzyme S subunit